MQGDALAVVALMLGFVSMLAVGVWCGLSDETRDEIARCRMPLLAGATALAGVLLLLSVA